ncbi:MAG: hypothetical protein J6U40_10340 [Kiritimatiellae bacterium]|nr:hypothetical protein [Kiritimatiellia bacterium]
MDGILEEPILTNRIEVKSVDADSVSGMHEFCRKYPQAKTYLVGGQGMPIEETLTLSAANLLSS